MVNLEVGWYRGAKKDERKRALGVGQLSARELYGLSLERGFVYWVPQRLC
jgi:hypothetical protein